MRGLEAGDRLRRGQVAHLGLDELGVQRMHEGEDAGVRPVVLPERLVVPGQKDELAHRLPHPGRVGIGHQRPAVPLPVTEPIADVVAQLVVAGKEPQLLIGVTVKVSRFAPAHHPGPAVHHGAPKAAQLQLEVDIVRHEHLGRVGDGNRLLEGLFELPFAPCHPLGERGDVEIEDERMIWLDRDQLDVFMTDQLLEAGQHIRAIAPHLQQEGDGEAKRDLHPFVHQRLEELGRGPVAVLRHFVEIAPVHLVVEDQRIHFLGRRAPRNQLGR